MFFEYLALKIEISETDEKFNFSNVLISIKILLKFRLLCVKSRLYNVATLSGLSKNNDFWKYYFVRDSFNDIDHNCVFVRVYPHSTLKKIGAYT